MQTVAQIGVSIFGGEISVITTFIKEGRGIVSYVLIVSSYSVFWI